MKNGNSLDMTQGPILKKILLFAIPVLMSTVLQHLYTIADRVVVGNFAADGTVALAAVGATAASTNMLLNLFTGLSLGANVVCANLRGGGEDRKLRKCMHTAVVLSAIAGVALMFIGVSLARPILIMTNTPADVLPMAVTYMRIFFLGMPASLCYNFSSAIMRAHGDTKRSMYILGVTGIVNVVLNLILVLGFRLDVAGVAIATITAQYLSAISVLWILFNPQREYKLTIKELGIDKRLLKKIVVIGVPCGINGILQNVSNVVLQSTVNSFGKEVIAGNTAATDINNFLYLTISAFSAACVSFSGQCYGARQYKRIDRLVLTAIGCSCSFMVLQATVVSLFPRQLLGIFNPDPAVVEQGMFKLLLLSWSSLFYAVSETMVGSVRGMGKSVVPTILNIICLCGVRIMWVLVVFPFLPREPEYLYLCYMVSWFIASIVHTTYYIHCKKSIRRRLQV